MNEGEVLIRWRRETKEKPKDRQMGSWVYERIWRTERQRQRASDDTFIILLVNTLVTLMW